MEEEHEEVVLQSSKHVCKVCNRRFACGRALGGHMRIHGSASLNQFSGLEEDGGLKRRLVAEEEEEEEEEEEQEASCGGDHLQIKKNEQMYDLRPNRRRTWRFADLDYSFAAVNGEFCSSKFPVFKNYQACVECGEEFSSWKSLIRHMECHFDDNKVEGGGEEDEDDEQSQSNVKEEEEEEVGVYWDSESDTERAPERKKSTKGKRSNRGNNTQRRPRPSPSSEVEFMASCLVMLASSGESWEPTIKPSPSLDDDCTTSRARDLKRKRRTPPAALCSGDLKKLVVPMPMPKKMKYECKTCKKMFASFQALGGHRASHNKVKGCSAKQDDDLEEEIITSDEDLYKDLPPKSTPDEEESVGLGSVISQKSPWLDLNLPAAPDDDPKWFLATQTQQGLCSISTPT
ncbi:zinc finger protein ZAT4 [Cryptomeria japonica]|uniref:zinc finger protein ZAT4 n=1 Tax=Cryptomeria japonica TaxID=3369 RepID=UPI0027DA42D2|nr:zinc finger protein ZAT4 [Cryptomeria japonica]